jgi:hypothetical protein
VIDSKDTKVAGREDKDWTPEFDTPFLVLLFFPLYAFVSCIINFFESRKSRNIVFIITRQYKSIAHIMNKNFWFMLLARPFHQAVILFILGICTIILPDIMRGLNHTLPWPLTIFCFAVGFFLGTTGFVALVMSNLFALMKKNGTSENREQNGQRCNPFKDERP